MADDPGQQKPSVIKESIGGQEFIATSAHDGG